MINAAIKAAKIINFLAINCFDKVNNKIKGDVND